METCPQCKAGLADGASSCPQCGWEKEATLQQSPTPWTLGGMPIQTEGRRALGNILGSRYQIVSKLGSGTFGEVYAARDTVLARRVAIKRIRLDALADETQAEEVKARFLREAQVAARLKHPNIVTIHDIVSSPNMSFIVMELIDGVTLQSVLQSKKRLTLTETIDILSQAGDALDHAHQNKVVHRDVKPANIMIESSGRVKVTDFGIAKAESSSNLTASGSIVGTPNYMSPEQARGKPLDGRSDLFSLGCILYECLTGIKPFQGDNVTAVLMRILTEDPPPIDSEKTGLPPAVSDVIHRALAKDPSSRYSSGVSLFDTLRLVPSVEPAAATMDLGPTRLGPPVPPATRRHRSADSTVSPAPPSPARDSSAAPVTIRRASPSRKTPIRRRWWFAATFALLAAGLLVGSQWWTNRGARRDDTPVAPGAGADRADSTELMQPETIAPSRAEKRELVPPAATESPKVVTSKQAPPEKSASDLPREAVAESAPTPQGEQHPKTQETIPKRPPLPQDRGASDRRGFQRPQKKIRANEKAAVERLIWLSRMQTHAKSKMGRYLTVREIIQRRQPMAGGRLRGNPWQTQGYRLILEVPRPNFFCAVAVPTKYGQSGFRSFYVDVRGEVRGGDKKGARATASDPVVYPR